MDDWRYRRKKPYEIFKLDKKTWATLLVSLFFNVLNFVCRVLGVL